MNNPGCINHSFFKTGYYFNKFIGELEYHHSGYELEFMKYLSSNENVCYWTKKHKIFIEYEYLQDIKKYWPDFLVEFKSGLRSIIELKGFKEDPIKLQCKIDAGHKYCNDNGYLFQIIFQTYKNDFKDIRDC